MEWKTFRENIASNLAAALIVLISGSSLAILKIYLPMFATPILYGLAGGACVATVLFTLTGKAIFSRKQPETTLENIEVNIRAWLDNFHLSAKKEHLDNAHFCLLVVLNSGNGIVVARLNPTERYLTFQTRIGLATEHQIPIDAMIPQQRDRVMREIMVELAKTKVGFRLEGPPFRSILIMKTSFITTRLTEDAFLATLDEMDSAVNLAKLVTVMAIERYSSSPA